MKKHSGLVPGLAVFLVAGCIDIQIPVAPTLFPTGTSFVVKGTMTVENHDGSCLVWVGENGVEYHLFQNPRVSNDDYDSVTTPGTTSRLVLATRDDLEVGCQVGSIVEVQDILEIVE